MKKNYVLIIAIMLTLSMFSQNKQGIIRKSTIQSSEYFERFNVNFNNKENVILSDEIVLEASKQIKISGYCDIVNENSVDIYYRIYTKNWNRWVKLKTSPHQESQIKNRIFYQGRNEFGNIKKIQFKIDNSKNNGDCTFKVFFPLKTLNTKTTYRQNLNNKNNSACLQPNYLSRDSWCLDNDCQNNNPIPTTPTHIAIHHSAGLDISPPYSAEVFSIWDDHVNDRGWDDIGYNWIISPDGQIFEGRGDGILGANFSCMNTGITGICLLGNFEFYTLNSPSGEAINSLVEIARWEAVNKNINIDGASFHNSSNLFLDHLIGHNDSNSSPNSCNITQCPGDNLSSIIPSIKQIIGASSCYQDFFNQCNESYEPNNTQSQATQLYQFGLSNSQSASLNGCIDQATADEDWFRINLANQGELTLTLSSQQISSLFIEWVDNGNITPSTNIDGDKQIIICSYNGPACYDTGFRIFTNQSNNNIISYTIDIQWSNQSCTSGRQSSTSNSSQNNATITINGNTSVCEGLSNTLSISGASGPFDWFVNGQSVHIGNTFNTQSLNTGQYDLFVIATDDVCSFAETQLNITSGITANAGSNVTIQNGGSTNLQGSGGSSCSWSPTTGLSNPNSCTTTASPTQTTTYMLTVIENGCTDTDTVTVTVDGSNSGNEPINDNCNDATNLTSNTSCNSTFGTIDYATDDGFPNDPSCDVHSNPNTFGVFYSFTAVSNMHNIIVDPTGQLDAVVTVYSGSNCYNLSEFDCEDTSGGNGVTTTLTNNNFVIGQQYWIRVYDYGNVEPPIGQGGFYICVTHTNTGNSDGTDLVSNITSVSNNNPDAGNTITINYTVTNIGDTATQYWIAPSFYLLTNTTLSGADNYLDSDTINQTISANETVNASVSVTIPNVSDGQYYLVVNPDPANIIAESNESNNLDFYLIQIGNVADNGPDLDVTGLTVTPSTGLVPGQEVEIEIDIENKGNVDCNDFDVLVFLDINGNNDYDTNEFMGEFNFNGLDAAEEDTVFVDFNLLTNITSTGTYELFVLADSGNAINETNENNNDKDRNITIAIANDGSEDVSILNESVSPTTINAGGDVNVVVSHVYLGSQTDADLPSIDLGYYLSTDCQLSIDDILLEDETSGLGSDDPIIEEDEVLTIPLGTPSGTYYILFVADMDNEVDEGVQENNNVECVEITVTNNNNPAGDIYITDQICTPYNVMVGNDVETFVNVHYSGNQLDADLPSFTLSFYLSTDCVFSDDDMFLDDTNISLGSDYPINDDTELNDLPANLSLGTYFIIFVADAENELYEVNENNNISCAEFQVFSANSNYQDITLTNPYVDVTETSVGDQIYVSVFQNYTGYQTDSDLDSVQVDYYLSSDCVLSTDDIFLDDDFSSIGSDDPSQFENQTLTIPDVVGDDYYILFVADATNIVTENDETNNLECIPITIQESTLGIEETEVLNKIKIYPNPVSDDLTINLGEIHSKINIEIYNMLGQRVNKLHFENKQTLTIYTSSYANGMYFFKINTDKFKTQEFKIIKE